MENKQTSSSSIGCRKTTQTLEKTGQTGPGIGPGQIGPGIFLCLSGIWGSGAPQIRQLHKNKPGPVCPGPSPVFLLSVWFPGSLQTNIAVI